MNTKTTLYLSIILTAWLIGKLFNPIPLSNYAFYLIIVALFIPYFGFWGCLKIVIFLSTVSVIQDLPFYLTFYQQWPMIFNSIMVTVEKFMPPITHTATTTHYFFHPQIQSLFFSYLEHTTVTQTNLETTLSIEGNGIAVITVLLSGFYFGVINALYAIYRTYKRH